MTQEHLSEKKKFSIIKRAQSFTHAGRGIFVYVKGTHNAWVHIGLFFVSILLGIIFCINRIEWTMLVFVCSFVIVTEAINTAIEIDIDLTSPNYHPYAKDTKDVAAGAVLMAAVAEAVILAIIFVPYILKFINTI